MRAGKVVFGTTLGTALEFYDFVIYAVLVPVMSPLFFPSTDPRTSLIMNYAAFALGYLIRPLGAVYFGSLGDRKGRKKALLLSLTLMAVGTVAIGCMPTYQDIGVWAPLCLILCRLVQGFSAGGEYSGAALVLIESRPSHMAYRSGVLICMTTLLAITVGNEFAKIFTAPSMPAWAWRIPFFIGGAIAFIAYFLRRYLTDEVFLQVAEPQTPDKRASTPAFSYRALLAQYGFQMGAMIIITGFAVMVYYTFVVYIVTYLKLEHGWAVHDAYGLAVYIAILTFFFLYIIGWVADKYRLAWPLMKAGALLFALAAVPIFYLLSYGSRGAIYVGSVFIAILFAMYGALHNTFSAQLFPVRLRYRGMALSYSVSASLIGGTAPLIYTKLLQMTGNPLSPGIYMAVVAFLAWVCLVKLDKRTLAANLPAPERF